MPTPERFRCATGIFMPARGMGVVGASVTSVGASAAAVRAGRGPDGGGGGIGRRWPLCVPGLGAVTGCSGQTAVANSSIVENRWSGSFESARDTAFVRYSGVPTRLPLTRGISSKMCL